MASELVSLFEQKMVIQNKTIDSLPIEMLRAVLINVEGKPLILARRVSRRWLNVIGHICKGKTSLVLQSKDSIYQIGNNPLSYLFNGLVNFSKNCAVLKTESDPLALSYNFSHLLAKLFPRVECLAIIGSLDGTTAKCLFALLALWSSTITSLRLPYISDSHRAAFVGQIAKLSALKRLDVHLIDDCLEPTTLAQLEHFTYYYNAPTVFARLGPGCTSLHLTGRTFSSTITRMFSDNAALVNGLTHLKVRIEQFDGLSIICSNFVALQMLDIAFEDRSGFDAESIALFAKLTKLTQLSINNFAIDFTLARVDLAVLPLMRILEMKDVTFFRFNSSYDDSYDDYLDNDYLDDDYLDDDDLNDDDHPAGCDHFDGDLFCRLFSIIFPSLEMLTMRLYDPIVCAAILQHLHRFTNLRKYQFTDLRKRLIASN